MKKPLFPESSGPLLKVCGLKYADNLADVAALKPALVGLIFAARSPRYVLPLLEPAAVRALPEAVRRVGVFVDEDLSRILELAERFGLDAVQLHGHETPDHCAALRPSGLRVIKAVAVGAEPLDWPALAAYVPVIDAFLFDAAGSQPGGNGIIFNWQQLDGYPFAATTPWLLAGGLRPDHAAILRTLHLPGLRGFDLNSGFEEAPGRKNLDLLKAFQQALSVPETIPSTHE